MKHTIRKWPGYILSKLSGAGLLLMIFAFFALLVTRFDWDLLNKAYVHFNLGRIVFGYGIVCSVVIDLIILRVKRYQQGSELFLYILAGGMYFVFEHSLLDSLGYVWLGAFCSSIFFFGPWIAAVHSPVKYFFSLIVPLYFLLIDMMYG